MGPPSVSWSFNGKQIEAEPRITMAYNQCYVQLQIADSTKYDTGEYCLKVENEAGSRSQVFKAKVLDIPSECQNLVVQIKTAHKCYVNWDKPEFTGNTDIIGYTVEKRETTRVSWTQIGSDIKGTMIRADRL